MDAAHAIVIGIAAYPGARRLPGTVVEDARAVAALLADPERCGYPPGNVRLLLNGEATGERIAAELREAAARTDADSSVLVYFSGHGGRVTSGPHAGEYLLPCDVKVRSTAALARTAIAGERFSEWLRALPARKLVVVFDCCHAAGLGQPKGEAGAWLETGLPDDYLTRLGAGRGRVVIASSRATEVSWVTFGAPNSLFTHHLLAGLRGAAAGEDGFVRIFDLFEYLQPRVTADQPRQHPVFKAELEENFPVALARGEGVAPLPAARDRGHQHGGLRLPLGYPQTGLQEDRNARAIMLDRVEMFWLQGVKRSLPNEVPMTLELRAAPEEVVGRWEGLVDVPEPEPWPAGTRITEVFEAHKRSLLILGEPGSGKTTALLEVARAALAHARVDPAQPIPVVFCLTSWPGGRTRLADWLVEELEVRYQVPRAHGRDWIEKGQLLLLLDSLDEVRLEHRPGCIERINQFLRTHGLTPIVVCCRTAMYQSLGRQGRLRLHGAVVLEPLSDCQLRQYLEGPQLAGVREAVSKVPALTDVARTPLALWTFAQAFRDAPAADLPTHGSPEEIWHQVFEVHTEKMLRRRQPRYAPERVRARLAWLARRMLDANEAVFLMERIQPEWLPAQRHLYVGLVALVTCVCLGGPFIPNVWRKFHVSTVTELGAAMLSFASFALVFVLIPAVRATTPIRTVEVVRWSWRRAGIGLLAAGAFSMFGFADGTGFSVTLFRSVMWSGLAGGLLGLAVWAVLPAARRRPGPSFAICLAFALALGVVFGFTQWILALNQPSALEHLAKSRAMLLFLVPPVVLFSGLTWRALDARVRFNGGIWRTAGNATVMAAGAVLAFEAALRFSADPSLAGAETWNVGIGSGSLYAGLLAWFVCGGFSCLKHAVLRLALWRADAMPWRAERFLDDAAERLLLQRVGAGYIFGHRLLLEHLAEGVPAQGCTRQKHLATVFEEILHTAGSWLPQAPRGRHDRRRLVKLIAYVVVVGSTTAVLDWYFPDLHQWMEGPVAWGTAAVGAMLAGLCFRSWRAAGAGLACGVLWGSLASSPSLMGHPIEKIAVAIAGTPIAALIGAMSKEIVTLVVRGPWKDLWELARKT